MSAAPGWDAARALTALAVCALPPRALPLTEAIGAVPSEEVLAERPLPHYDSAAMDGYAVRGEPPWRLLAGDGPLDDGEAREVVTGAAVPTGAEAVVAVEHTTVTDRRVRAVRPHAGQHIRHAGEEAPAGTPLAAAGERLSPAAVAVLAIAGFDAVVARPRARVAVVLTGDEVDTAGAPRAGRVRDAFDPLMPAVIDRLGGTVAAVMRTGDDPAAIRAAIDGSGSDAVVTVGGTGRSRADRLRDALVDAETVFDGVAMRPGHPSLLMRLADGRPLLGLPGNPLAAIAALLSFLPPALDGLQAVRAPDLPTERAAVELERHPGTTALVPARLGSGGLEPSGAARPNMLRGLAAARVLAVVPADGAAPGDRVRVLPLPW